MAWIGCTCGRGLRKIKIPWRKGILGTLTGSSKWLIRYKYNDWSPVQCRLLKGVEAMQVIGWDHDLDWIGLPAFRNQESELQIEYL